MNLKQVIELKNEIKFNTFKTVKSEMTESYYEVFDDSILFTNRFKNGVKTEICFDFNSVEIPKEENYNQIKIDSCDINISSEHTKIKIYKSINADNDFSKECIYAKLENEYNKFKELIKKDYLFSKFAFESLNQ